MVSLTPEALDGFLRANWREPRSLRKLEQPDPYPVECLPPLVRDAVVEVTGYLQAPRAMVAGCALAAISAAVQTTFSVRRDSVLKGPASLYVLTVAESGERKSTVDNLFMAPLREWQVRQEQVAKIAMAEHLNDLREWQEADDRDEADKPTPPRVPRMLRGDDTAEALAKAIAEYPVAAVMSAEAGVILGSFSMSSDSVTRTLAQANTMWDGGPLDQARISRERIRVDQMRVTMGLQVQPGVLERFREKTGGLGRAIGYFARFLLSHPESTVGSRYYQSPPDGTPKLAAFQSRIAELLLVEAQFDENDQLVSHYLPLSREAHATWVLFHDEVEERTNPDHEYAGIRDVASKAAENAARIACCLHVFVNGGQAEIGPEIMRKSCALMRWYLDEADRFTQRHGAPAEIGDAETLEGWLVGHHKKLAREGAADTLCVNMVRQLGPNRLRVRARADAALQLLQDHGRLRVQKGQGTKTEYIQIAPQVLAEWS